MTSLPRVTSHAALPQQQHEPIQSIRHRGVRRQYAVTQIEICSCNVIHGHCPLCENLLGYNILSFFANFGIQATASLIGCEIFYESML